MHTSMDYEHAVNNLGTLKGFRNLHSLLIYIKIKPSVTAYRFTIRFFIEKSLLLTL